MENRVAAVIAAHKRHGRGGIVSVCSAHPAVIRAAEELAREYGATLLLESTSNQVDQFGGYTGLTPADFIAQVKTLLPADAAPVFGGDHLGPNRWQHLPSDEAMKNSEELIRHYVQAGYEKIHLDCSMSCAGDPVPLPDATVAERAARLCRIAEDTRAAMPGAVPLVYIIGTEVPVPGGAKEALDGVTPTTPDAARTTYAVHKDTFAAHGLGDDVWARVVALVVQPGVEFDHHGVEDYRPERATALSAVAHDFPHAVFEAHSTDYQTPQAFKDLVRDHFAILKVGPALTFAYREALFGLSQIAIELGLETDTDLIGEADTVMREAPADWQKYYHGDRREQRLLRAYSLSDRIRYYWTKPRLAKSVQELLDVLGTREIPLGVAHQYLPLGAEACRARGEKITADNLINNTIKAALAPYYAACA
ncbi:class II D-tagatose-bisphosphate aldolase, non-catalytic subunit [Cardiobacterium hominis]|uniref:class II D-tagatose-bisphosphate aldolase, non-catalytic subunit n=1 Tax=Cardiobacterium hominis TaxID=2718 RepID=UPI0006615FBF|nr:class II D-tagatose-bisphosphate aldolase, non-catalytic subunit [Cardiobacterium hominis]